MTETETSKKETEYQYPVNECNEYDDPETEAPVQEYDKYGAPEYQYDKYELTEEDIILKELNTRYSKKGAYVALALVAAAFTTGTIIMSQKWVPQEITTTTSTTTTTAITTTSTTLPERDPDQVRDSKSIKILS